MLSFYHRKNEEMKKLEEDGEDEDAINKLIKEKEKEKKKNKDSSDKRIIIKPEAILPDTKKKLVTDSLPQGND